MMSTPVNEEPADLADNTYCSSSEQIDIPDFDIASPERSKVNTVPVEHAEGTSCTSREFDAELSNNDRRMTSTPVNEEHVEHAHIDINENTSSSSSSSSDTSSSSSSSAGHNDDSVQDPDYQADSSIRNTADESTATLDVSIIERALSPEPLVLDIEPRASTSNHNKNPSRKRKADPKDWLQNKRKYLRNKGESYTTAKNVIVKAKYVKTPCDENCRFKCSLKMTDNERKQIFNEYWELDDIDRKRDYINNKIEPIQNKYRYTTTQKGRNLNHAFYFYLMGQKIRVCKKFFMRTLDINDRTIKTVFSKKTSTGGVTQDMRGKHGNQPRVPEEIKYSIRNHINSIPRIESHYLRQQTTREFIDGGKTLTDLFNDYKEERTKYYLPFGNYVLYSKIFNTEYNLGFHVPKKDLCELCDSYKNATGAGKVNLEEKYVKHLEEKNLSRAAKNEDKEKVNDSYIVAVYDLQAVLPCPKGEVSVFYYKSKLNTFNLTVTELVTKNTECYLWHEAEANRGSDEIGSCVYKYIEKKMTFEENSSQNESNKDIVFYSDSCSGQNKNKYIIALYIYAVLKFTQLRSITHKFLIPGHTQNENDSAHSVIEKAIKRNLKSGPIYVPSQYAQIIRGAKKQGQPYNVNELTHENFISLKQLAADLKFTLTGFKISQAKIIKYTKESPNILYYKKSYADDAFSEVRIWRRCPTTLPNVKLAYETGINLGIRKVADLMSLVRDNHIPTFYKPFFDTLTNQNNN